MPSAYHIDVKHRLVITRGLGAINDADLLGHARQLATDPLFAADMRQLVDLRFVSSTEVTIPGLRELAHSNPFGAGSLRAIVANDDLTFGLSRMYEMLRDHDLDQVSVFRDMDEAILWLELTEFGDELRAVLQAMPTTVLST